MIGNQTTPNTGKSMPAVVPTQRKLPIPVAQPLARTKQYALPVISLMVISAATFRQALGARTQAVTGTPVRHRIATSSLLLPPIRPVLRPPRMLRSSVRYAAMSLLRLWNTPMSGVHGSPTVTEHIPALVQKIVVIPKQKIVLAERQLAQPKRFVRFVALHMVRNSVTTGAKLNTLG